MPVERSIQGSGACTKSSRAGSSRPPCSKKRSSILSIDTAMPPETFPMLALAMLADAVFGYPGWVFRRIGHPVTWIGAFIGLADRHLNREGSRALIRKLAGVLTAVCITAGAAAGGFVIQRQRPNCPLAGC